MIRRRAHRQLTWGAMALLGFLWAFWPAAGAVAQFPGGAREVRAVWVTRWDYKTEEDVRNAVRWASALGFNRIFFQVRGRADAFYRSTLEPWGEELGGRDPGFDPLRVALDEARARGVDLDAWINVMPGWKGSRSPRNPQHILHRHPDWFLVDQRGERHLKSANEYTILNPCLPEVRAYLEKVVQDIAGRYPVGGIHLDYVRFIGRGGKAGHDFPYDPRSLALFKRYSGGAPFDRRGAWDKWRRLAINTVLHRLAKAARTSRPGCRVSVAAIQDFNRARDGLFQDVVTWQKEGWVDEVYPMTYVRSPSAFAGKVRAVLGHGLEGNVFPGVGAYLHTTVEETVRQIEVTRAVGTRGFAVFAFANLFPSPSHESKDDAEGRRLRFRLRRKIFTLNGGDLAANRSPVASARE
jgi:uncharacterized lipoprotein YddW (UPF0748 family)